MRGINPQKIPDLIKGDVELVKTEARFVFVISPDEKTIAVSENDNPRLNVFAVIGPSEGFGRHWDEALLAEIGIARTRPYREAKGLYRKAGQTSLHKRRKWFFLSEKQYQLVAPVIFKIMDIRAEKIVASWKSGCQSNRFLISVINHYWLRSRKRMVEKGYMLAVLTGIRFHASLKDEFFVRDIFWAELNQNKAIKKQINGLAKFISLRLHWYNEERYKGRKKITELIGYQEVKQRIENCYLKKFPHLMVELAKKLKQDHRLILFFPYLADIFNWYGGETEERKLASLAPETPYLAERLGKIQVVVTTDLSKKQDFITFEVQK